jgi:NADPH:quinone reductase-like Zn-dependent oxidoreductase
MKAAIFKCKGTIEVGQRPDPQIQQPTDAIVRVVRGCVCGSDLWYYRGINQHKVGSIGHEYIGVVEAVGSEVRDLAEGASSSRRSPSTTAPAPHAGPASSPTALTAVPSATRPSRRFCASPRVWASMPRWSASAPTRPSQPLLALLEQAA